MWRAFSYAYVFVSLAFLAGLCSAQPVEIYIEKDFSLAYFDQSGEPVGPAIDIVRAIQQSVGSDDPLQLVPWVRGYNEVRTKDKRNSVLLPTAFTEERRESFRWIGPIVDIAWVLYAEKNSTLEINNLDDARRVKRVGVLRGDVRREILDLNGFKNYVNITNNQYGIKMLLASRLDLWFGDSLAVNAFIRREGIALNDIKPMLTLEKTGLYIAFSRNTADSIYNRWNDAFKKLSSDRTIEKILINWKYPMPTHKIPLKQ